MKHPARWAEAGGSSGVSNPAPKTHWQPSSPCRTCFLELLISVREFIGRRQVWRKTGRKRGPTRMCEREEKEEGNVGLDQGREEEWREKSKRRERRGRWGR